MMFVANAMPIMAVETVKPAAKKWNIPVLSWLNKREEDAKVKAIMNLAGCLKNSPVFGDDPVAYFRKERDGWDDRLASFNEA